MKAKASEFRIRPHANAAVHRKVLAQLKKMTPAEGRQSLIDAGILTKSGKLKKIYQTPGPYTLERQSRRS